MADSKLTALTALASPTSDDIMYIVDDPSGSPLSRKIALSDLMTFVGAYTQSLTNKTLILPVIASIVNTGTLTLPTSTDTLIGRNTTDTVTNKTLTTSNVIKTPMCRVYNTAAQTIANTTVTALTFDSERFDTDTIHSISADTSRLTCKTAGVYQIGFSGGFASNSTGYRSFRLRLNGGSYLSSIFQNAVNGDVTFVNISTLYELAVNDYVEIVVYQTSGGNLDTFQNANDSPEMYMSRVAPASSVA